ncbi:uncharacterized protein FOMMEDRAFT_153801 [Fomitiporia mediterranea MF3/22]|uniref:uncharacterized protein n=1 Tax=Fomitiporia mediterranea (strain MF3/22) TaxID=694068 RepID=UPI0004407737|nr:uncharacterized protein FOMMEDRAFT_153801 [Fomitiporia mediterranea MF3/22]EJD04723.1 hypothetical protein FOMMEDRAFT_153801 [Fomitiporia mediterranea MF3/22]
MRKETFDRGDKGPARTAERKDSYVHNLTFHSIQLIRLFLLIKEWVPLNRDDSCNNCIEKQLKCSNATGSLDKALDMALELQDYEFSEAPSAQFTSPSFSSSDTEDQYGGIIYTPSDVFDLSIDYFGEDDACRPEPEKQLHELPLHTPTADTTIDSSSLPTMSESGSSSNARRFVCTPFSLALSLIILGSGTPKVIAAYRGEQVTTNALD